MKCSEIAYKAAEYMAEHGHCKGTLTNERGRVCFIGALRKTMRLSEDGMSMFKERDITLKAQELGYSIRHDCLPPVPAWNDAPERTGEDVILALKHVGAELEAEGK